MFTPLTRRAPPDSMGSVPRVRVDRGGKGKLAVEVGVPPPSGVQRGGALHFPVLKRIFPPLFSHPEDS